MLSQLINTTKHDNVRIDALRLDGGTQPRHGINAAYVTELAESIVEGATLPPVEVIYDGANYWLYDGFHRVAAHQQAGIIMINANIRQGAQADAQWRSYAANQTHGLRRTNDDKQRAIQAALRHPNGVTMANREIARHLGVDHKTVGDWREKLEATGEIPQSTTRTGADGRTIDTTNIGTNQPPTVDPWLAALNGDGPPVSVMEIARRLAAVIEPWVAAWVDDKGRTWRDVANRNPQHANSPFRQDLQAELARRGLRLSGMATGEAIRLAFQALSMRDGAQAVTASGLPPLELRTVGAMADHYVRHLLTQMDADGALDHVTTSLDAVREIERLLSCHASIARLVATAASDLLAGVLDLEVSTAADTRERNHLDATPPVISNQDRPLPDWAADDPDPDRPPAQRPLTGKELCTALLGQAIVDVYNLPGSVRLMLENNQTITINGAALHFTIEEA
jgi:uncharacterized ParB-like nuclease family protein